MWPYHTWLLLGRRPVGFRRRHEYVAHFLRRRTVSLGLISKVSVSNQVCSVTGFYTCPNPVLRSFFGIIVFWLIDSCGTAVNMSTCTTY